MSRIRINLNREWKFFRGDAEGAQRPDFDDSGWQSIGLPHTFDLPYFRTPEFYAGVGWYRKRLLLPLPPGEGWGEGASGSGAALLSDTPSPLPFHRPISGHDGGRGRARLDFLEFDGAFQVAEVFVNGTRAGEHRGGYTGFTFEITEHLRAGENILAVRVDNNWNPRLQPRAGEHIFSGGLYRDVHLLLTNAIHIADHQILTPLVSIDRAEVNVVSELNHGSAVSSGTVLVITQIVDPNGHSIWHGTETSLADETVSQRIPIEQPKLWHPDHPHLYLARTQIIENGEVIDEVETTFGLRFFEWTPDRGFFLNGERLYLRGANAHQDHAGWGIGITRAACERDVRLVKEAGFNFIRGAHYPHHPAFAEACDRLGLIFWSENAFWGKGGFGPEGYWNASAYPVNEEDFAPFEEHCKESLREMIEQNRNHPSIMAWSMTNEAFFTYNLDRAKKLMKDLVDLSRKLDPTRPAAIGGAQRGDVDHIGDIAGYNGDGARLFIDPGVPNMVSEYGAISKPHDAFEPFFGELHREEFPWRSGEAIWAGFDYGSIAGKQGLKGIVNHQRLPKRSWHWYRKHLRNIEPPPWPQPGVPRRLRLRGDKTVIHGTDATDDCQLIVTVCDDDGNHISNSPPVTLTIESGPGEFPTGSSTTFDATTDIGITDGEAAIAFRSYHGGETVIRATSPGLEDATITIGTEGEPKWIEGVTPRVAPRPYTPPQPSLASIDAMRNAVNVALNRPSRASNERTDHPARFANDGNPASFWSSDQSSDGWWLVDLEGFYQVSSIKLVFPFAANWRFIAELSKDNSTWDPAIDRSQSQRTDAIRNDILPPGSLARYVRITIIPPPDSSAQIAEVELYGVLSVR